MQEAINGIPVDAARWKNPLASLRRKVSNAAQAMLYGKPQKELGEPVLPYTLQYAMQYKEGMIGQKEVGSLIENNLTDLSTYALLKIHTAHPELQKTFLTDFVNTVTAHPGDKGQVKSLQQKELEQLGNFPEIKGLKVAQIVRQGVQLWEGKFSEVANEIAEKPTDVVPVYVAYAGLLGLRQGIEKFKGTDRKLMIMIPDWVDTKDNPNCGYVIDFKKSAENKVEFLPKDFQRPSEFVIIDDTRRNGVHAQIMWDFWTQNSGQPVDESRVRVVNFAPKDSRI